MTISCRSREMSKLTKPLPMAWKKVEKTMPKAAKTKQILMIRRAGTPISSIWGVALKNMSSTWGKIIKINMPTAMMATAMTEADFGGVEKSFAVFGAKVVAHNGHEAVVEAENRHKDKGLELVINAQHRHSCGREDGQNGVETNDEHGGNGLHNNGGKSHLIDFANNAPFNLKFLKLTFTA